MRNLFLILLLMPTILWAGHDQGGGGDGTAMEFRQIGYDVTENLLDQGISLVAGVVIGDLQVILSQANVESTDQELLVNFVRKDALNYPGQKRILINRSAWHALSSKAQMQLVIHEGLGLLKVADEDYSKSDTILAAYKTGVASQKHQFDSLIPLVGGKIVISHDILLPKNLDNLIFQDGKSVSSIDYSKPYCVLAFYNSSPKDRVLKARSLKITGVRVLSNPYKSDDDSVQYVRVALPTFEDDLINNVQCGEVPVYADSNGNFSNEEIAKKLSVDYSTKALLAAHLSLAQSKVNSSNFQMPVFQNSGSICNLGSSLQSAQAPKYGKPTAPPTKPLPAACRVGSSAILGSFVRTRTSNQRASNVQLSCPAKPGHNLNNPPCYYNTVMCSTTDVTVSNSDNSLQSTANQLATARGCDPSIYSISYTLTDWTTSQDGSAPKCVPVIEDQTVNVVIQLSGELLKQQQCNQINICLPQLSSSTDILLAQEWQNQIGCK